MSEHFLAEPQQRDVDLRAFTSDALESVLRVLLSREADEPRFTVAAGHDTAGGLWIVITCGDAVSALAPDAAARCVAACAALHTATKKPAVLQLAGLIIECLDAMGHGASRH